MSRGRPEKVTLIERVVTERLSAAGIDLLFSAADVLSEGNGPLGPGETYYGTTMLTFSLAALEARLDDPVTPPAMELLRRLVEADVRVRRRLSDLARVEASRQCGGRALDACDVDVAIRLEGLSLLVDLDVQATVAMPHPEDRAA